MYGHPFLLENLPPTDSVPLADYLLYLNLLQKLLREQADQILSHTSEEPRVTTQVAGSLTLSSGTSLDWPSSSYPHNDHCCQAQQDPPMTAPLKDKTLPTNFRLFHYKKG
jgi:hypothetical protein